MPGLDTLVFTISGRVVDTSETPIASARLAVKLLSVSNVLTEAKADSSPIIVTTDAKGSFTLSLSNAVATSLANKSALVFQDAAATGDLSSTRSTPLFLSPGQSTDVTLRWNRPAQKLEITTVARDGKLAASALSVSGRIIDAQGLPIPNLSVKVKLRLQDGAALSIFPLPAEAVPTDERGRFTITIPRGGDLLSYKPYSPFVFSIVVTDYVKVKTMEMDTATQFYVSPLEHVELTLGWPSDGSSRTTFELVSFLRNGIPSDPTQGVLTTLGQLFIQRDRAPWEPLASARTRVRAGTAKQPSGEFVTDGDGYFPLRHPWPLGTDPATLEMTWEIDALDLEGSILGTGLKATRIGVSDSAQRIELTWTSPADNSPTIKAVASAMKVTLSSALEKYLADKSVQSLRDVTANGGLMNLPDHPAGEEAMLKQLDDRASIWSVLPAKGAEQTTTIEKLLERKFTNLSTLGDRPRSAVAQGTTSEFGDFKAAQLQSVAAARGHFLNQILLGAQAGARYAPPQSGGTPMGVSPMGLDGPPPCECEECQTAVSPNSYLADLMRYTSARVWIKLGASEVQLPAGLLQPLFYQPFAEFIADCDSMSAPVRTARLNVEALRAFGGVLADQLKQEGPYRKAVYNGFLAELGTSTAELRLASTSDSKLADLATRLGLPSKTEVLALLLEESDILAGTVMESHLETLFGLRDTYRPWLSPTPSSRLLDWRQRVLHQAWAEQDRLETWPKDTPILDPDTLSPEDLRFAWVTTADRPADVLKKRRGEIDKLRDDLTSDRATKLGTVIFPIVTGEKRAPTPDEQWAGYLTVLMGEDEVRSYAAQLPWSQQEQAMLLTAEKKVLAASNLRNKKSEVKLSKEEQSVVESTVKYLQSSLTYSGTDLAKQVDEKARVWVTDTVGKMAPTSKLDSTLTYASWKTHFEKLRGLTPTSGTDLPDVRKVLTRFSLTDELFLRIMDLSTRVTPNPGGGFRALVEADWSELDAGLTAQQKFATKWKDWADFEQTKMSPPLVVSPQDFWIPKDPPLLNPWLGSDERRSLWQRLLLASMSAPIIDPDLISMTAFVDTTSAAFGLYQMRLDGSGDPAKPSLKKWESDIAGAVSATTSVATFDQKLLNAYLGIPGTAATDVSKAPWYDPGTLQLANDQGTLSSARLSQLGLDRAAFQHLFRVRGLLDLIDKGATLTIANDEWKAVIAILVQVTKRRNYGIWRTEESAAKISLSPLNFKLPEIPPLTFPPKPVEAFQPRPWRATITDLSAFFERLQRRITEAQALREELNGIVDRVEGQTITMLRDLLISLYAPDPTQSLAAQASWFTDRILLDFAADACSKTTRVAQACTTLQTIIFSLHNGTLFRYQRGDTVRYPTLRLESDRFETEWSWIGSYATWRAAMFVFIYPENLLYPTLRAAERKSQGFADLLQGIQTAGRLTPQRACALAERYQAYFDDVLSLSPQATCMASALIPPDRGCINPVSGKRRDLFFCFAIAKSGTAYFNYREMTESDNGTATPWEAIKTWINVEQILGAVPFHAKDGKRYVVLFGMAKGTSKTASLQCMRLDLDALGNSETQWGQGPHDLSDPPQGSDAYKSVSYVVEQVVQERLRAHQPPVVVIGLYKTLTEDLKTTIPPWPKGVGYLALYRRTLNDDATGWSDEAFDDTFYGNVYNTGTLVAAANTYRDVNYCVVLVANGNAYYLVRWGGGEIGRYSRAYTATGYGDFGGFALLFYGGALLFFNNGLHVYVNTDPKTRLIFSNGSPVYALNCSFERLSHFSRWRPIVDLWGKGVAMQGWLDMLLLHPLGVDWRYSEKLIPTTSTIPINEVLTVDERVKRTQLVKDAYQKNASRSLTVILDDALYSVPMQLALDLQKAGFYEEALAWYRSIYDYTALPPERKVFYPLVQEESTSSSYDRAVDWLRDPMNPHAIAALRQYAYTRFVLMMIVRCLLDYADAMFTEDTAETLPKARVLYDSALWLLETGELAMAPCATLPETLDRSLLPAEWSLMADELDSKLRHVAAKVGKGQRSTLVAKVHQTLKDTTVPKPGARLKSAYRLISTTEASIRPPKLVDAIVADDQQRAQGQLAVLRDPTWRRAADRLSLIKGRGFRAAASRLTGVDAQTLDDKKDLKIDALLKPASPPKVTRDPNQRVPVLVQPATAISDSFRALTFWDPLDAKRPAIEAQLDAAAPIQALVAGREDASFFGPMGLLGFCIPSNPTVMALQRRAQLNLYKLHSCRNIAGLQRDVEFYAAPTDAQTGMPTLGAGGLTIPGRTRLAPTQFRFQTLLDRARRLADLAGQFEGAMLQAIEKQEQEQRALLDAKNALKVQQASLNIKRLEIEDAQLGVSIVQKQQEKVRSIIEYYSDLIEEDMNGWEIASLALMQMASIFQIASGGLSVAAASAAFASAAALNSSAVQQGLGSLASSMSAFGSAASVQAQIASTMASYARRKKEWQQQRSLGYFDLAISGVQLEQANLHVRIKQEEEQLLDIQIEQSQTVVDFLINKFANAQLYEWMSRILQQVYATVLQQAAATARQAEQQLAFDRLENVSFIKPDYWTVPAEGLQQTSSGPDRRGLTGSARLRTDLEALDNFAVTTDRRRLQLTRTISLAALAPGEFQRLRETGEMWFATSERDFDREFPGHHFRRIRRVRMSVVALVPPAYGIRATLSNTGLSRVVVPSEQGFEARVLPASFDSVSYASPQNATGIFELDPQSELRLPFEGIGVDTQWRLELPRAANPFDFRTLADVLLTFEYTALDSPDYRATLLQDTTKLPRTLDAVRAFSFRNELADSWRELANPGPMPKTLKTTFTVRADDFPVNLKKIRVNRISLYMPVSPDDAGDRVDLSLQDASKVVGLSFNAGASAPQAFTSSDHLIVADNAAAPWFRLLPASGSPVGKWTLEFKPTETILELFRTGLVQDILIAFSYTGDLPAWPTGQRPTRSLF